jgi:Na+-transporting methylmalonyl-CoA/oxaloacetate decarboxylase gamma subunit
MYSIKLFIINLTFKIMKKALLFLSLIAVVAIMSIFVLNSCKEDIVTEMTINQIATPQLDVGDDATATITIVAEGVKSLKYFKVVDTQKGAATDVTSQITSSGNTYTYNFVYEVAQFDDLHTLGFEFELTDSKNVVKTVGLAVNINISIASMLVKYDWKVTASTDPVWGDVLSAADAAIIYRFHEDGTYEEDLSPAYAEDSHHFCYCVYKETPGNADTLAIVRLIRRLKSGDTAVDEYYDYKILSASETQMMMFWEIKVWGLKITNTFKSQAKGAFVPYGTPEVAALVSGNAALSCTNIDNSLLTIQ